MKTHFYNNEIIEICNNNHLTIDEIFKEITKKYPKAWKSSIYRNVEELANRWFLRKIIWIWKKAYFEKVREKHIHLIDEKTWKITDLDLENINIPEIPKNFNINKIDIKVFWNFY